MSISTMIFALLLAPVGLANLFFVLVMADVLRHYVILVEEEDME